MLVLTIVAIWLTCVSMFWIEALVSYQDLASLVDKVMTKSSIDLLWDSWGDYGLGKYYWGGLGLRKLGWLLEAIWFLFDLDDLSILLYKY